MDPQERAEAARHVRHRLAQLEAIVAALDNYRDVTEAIVGAEDRLAAIAAVGRALGIDDDRARGIVELQWGRLTRDTRARVLQDQQELMRDLHQFED